VVPNPSREFSAALGENEWDRFLKVEGMSGFRAV